MYVVTGYDLNKMLDEVGKITGNASDARATAYLRTGIYLLSGYIGDLVQIADTEIENPGTLPEELQYAVLVPYTAALSAVGEMPVQSMSEGGDTVTYATTAKPRMSDYKAILSRYKRLRTPKHNKVV